MCILSGRTRPYSWDDNEISISPVPMYVGNSLFSNGYSRQPVTIAESFGIHESFLKFFLETGSLSYRFVSSLFVFTNKSKISYLSLIFCTGFNGSRSPWLYGAAEASSLPAPLESPRAASARPEASQGLPHASLLGLQASHWTRRELSSGETF